MTNERTKKPDILNKNGKVEMNEKILVILSQIANTVGYFPQFYQKVYYALLCKEIHVNNLNNT